MSKRVNFPSGIGTALVTPFKDGQVDHYCLAQLVAKQIESGIDYLVLLGTTGETSTLSHQEIQEVIRTAIDATAGAVPLVLGALGGNNTAELLRRLESWDLSAFSAVLSASPHYNKPSQAGIIDHYLALDEVTPVPIIMYNVPGRTSSNMTAATTLTIAKEGRNIMGIKEASADLIQGAKILKDRPNGFFVLSGDDPTALPLMSMGGEGIISVIANAFPAEFRAMVHHALAGDFEQARELHFHLLDLHPHLYVEGNPTGIKACMQELNMCTSEVRLPLKSLSKGALNKMRSVLEDIQQRL